MKADTWMPLYISDYAADTFHLSTEQHGAYLLLLMSCWKRGGSLPVDDAQLAATVRLPLAAWKKHSAIVMAFFVQEGAEYHHKRVSAELCKAQKLSIARRDAGAKGGRPKKQSESDEKPIGYANPNQNGSQTETPQEVARPSPSPLPSEVISDANASSGVSAEPKPPGPGLDPAVLGGVASLLAGGVAHLRQAEDVQKAFDAWNELARRLDLPEARKLDEARRKAIRARLGDGGLEAWTEALAAVERSKHCRGENDRNWRADLDFVCQPKSWRRLLEGFYSGKPATPSAPAKPWIGPAELRAAIVMAQGEAFAINYLDPALWQELPERKIRPRTSYAADMLKRDVSPILRQFGVIIDLESERGAA